MPFLERAVYVQVIFGGYYACKAKLDTPLHTYKYTSISRTSTLARPSLLGTAL